MWDDVQDLPNLTPRQRELGLRSQIATQFVAGERTYVLTLASLEAPSANGFDADDIAYVEVLGAVFARQIELGKLENSLRDTENRSRRQAERLEALWRIANNPSLRGPELIFAMLRQAGAVIRETQPFNGVLGHIEGDEIVVVAVGPGSGAADPRKTRLRVGQRTPIDRTIISRVTRSQAWDDTSKLVDLPTGVADVGWRSAIVTQFDVGESRYSLMFWSPEPTTTPFGPDDFAFLEVLASSFAAELQLDVLQNSLRDEEERSRQHAERLETLWQLVNDPGLRDTDLWLAMLGEAAAAIRPGQGYQGSLWRIEGTDMVMEAVTESSARVPGAVSARVGTVRPLDSTVVGMVLAEGVTTRAWDDLLDTPYVSTQGARSFVFTTFSAGGATWGVSFASSQPSIKAFRPQDNAYLEVLASFFANHVQQRWQFERIQHQQTYDVLTGLLNRSQFRSRARAASNQSERYAMLLVDINSFREINETYGHMIGDALLVEVGNALVKRAAHDEIVGRVAGDVFGIYVAEAPSREFVRERALAFADVFSSGFSTGDREGTEFIALTCSIGAAVAPEDGPKIDAILSHADAALVAAKQPGRDSLVFFEPGMEGDATRRATLRNELTEAIAGNQFELYYQPHVEISTSAVTGCEALIRWNHPTRGLVLPGEFIPFAEETGIITAIDAWVMRAAFAAANELGALREGFRLYFNLSGRQAGDPKMVHAFADARPRRRFARTHRRRDHGERRHAGRRSDAPRLPRTAPSSRAHCDRRLRYGLLLALIVETSAGRHRQDRPDVYLRHPERSARSNDRRNDYLDRRTLRLRVAGRRR